MAKATISVAMATYNGARFLREQLDSIAAQTRLPDELVITDDASTDATTMVIRAFAQTAPFPVHLHQNPERIGYRANFMRAMGLCASDLIAFCDQDDIWAPDKLQRCQARLEEPDTILAYHEAWLLDGDGTRREIAWILRLADSNPPSSVYPLVNPYGFSMVFRRSLLAFTDLWDRSRDNLYLDQPMAHDQWVFFLASAFGTIAYLHEPLTGYRLHGANTYGFTRPVTRRERMSDWINIRSKDYASLTAAAANRAMLLEAIRPRVGEAWRERADLAIARYRLLSRHCALRADVYGRRMPGRAKAWVDLLREGGYGKGTRWLFGRKAGFRDLFYLSLPRTLVRALLPPNPSAGAASGNGATPSGPSNGDTASSGLGLPR